MIVGLFLLLMQSALPQVSDPRCPTVSPDGSEIVFCWRGDLWTVPSTGGLIRCLTPADSYESRPSWSPDGTRIAFTSDRTGGGDVYSMPSSGGEALRLTSSSAFDAVLGWSPAGDSVYFKASLFASPEWVYSVAVSGGTPVLRLGAAVESLSGQGDDLLVERGFTPWWRRHYSGSASRDIWEVSGGSWTLLQGTPQDERWPLCVPGGVLFVREDASGSANFHLLGADGSVSRVTSLPGDVTFPSVSRSGSLVAFEYAGELWRLDTSDWAVERVDLIPAVDLPVPLEVSELAGAFTDSYSLLSDTGQIAIAGDGELFCGKLSDGSIEDVRRLTRSEGREGAPEWSPDGRYLAFDCEEGGSVALFIAGPADADSGFTVFGFPRASRIDLPSSVASDPHWSPDGSSICYLDEDQRLHVVDAASRTDRLICETAGIIHSSWSPDSRWLAFSVPDLANCEDVFIVSAAGGSPTNVSRHPNDDFQPFWPSDGRRLIYASRTEEGDYSIRQTWLTREDFGADREHREELIDDPLSEVVIDFDGLPRRTETLCTVEGYYDFFGASPDGRTVAFRAYDESGGSDLWAVDWTGDDLRRLTFDGEAPMDISITAGGTVYYLGMGGVLRSCLVSGGQDRTLIWMCMSDWTIPGRQRQKFDECWRLLRDNFYDPAMHGVDWEGVRGQYRERAAACILNDDFNDVVSRMLGELSASHLGIYGPWRWTSGAGTGELGIIPDGSWQGEGIRVDSVIPWSPADLPGSVLQPGDVILSVEGTPVGPRDDFFRPLEGRVGRETVLEVRRGGGVSEVTITPISAWELSSLSYDAWIDRNRRIVSGRTGDRVGYLHIPGMNSESVEGFLRDLFAEGLERDGMIIDIRDNGGGSTHDQILRQLSRPGYLQSRQRSGLSTLQPLGVWQKPVVLLINERCYSDAEIFPAGWKALGIGPVIGNTTFGAVIGTNDLDLVDGTGFRVPSEGWYTLEGINLENCGVTPDVFVIEMPDDFGAGRDRQLDEAIEVVTGLLD